MHLLVVVIFIVGQASFTVAVNQALLELSATQLLERYKTSGLTPKTYVENLINHTNLNEKTINAFITYKPSKVLADVKTKQYYQDQKQCLYGLPIAVKDILDVEGYPVTAGTPRLRKAYPKSSAPTIKRLLALGAVIYGKTNMHELQFGVTTDNAYFGPTRNPWNTTLIPGGSSGGSVASVSARFTPVALCGDTIASCRLPAALVGVIGFRPSRGRYPDLGFTPTSLTLDTTGINARTVEDIVLIDGAITDGSCEQKPTPRPLTTIRLGFDQATFLGNVDPDLGVVFNKAIQTLTNAGVTIVPIDFTEILRLDNETSASIYLHEWFPDLRMRLKADYKEDISLKSVLDDVASPDVQAAVKGVRDGTLTVHKAGYNSAIYITRPQLQAQLQDIYDNFGLDGIMFPTSRLTARPIGQTTVVVNGQEEPVFNAYISFTSFGAVAGVPGISIPVGLTADSILPVGMEIEGPYGKDRDLLNVAASVFSLFPPLGKPTDVIF